MRKHLAHRAAAWVAAALVLFPALAKSGIWDPYELDSADLARRIAIHAFHAKGLELPNASNALPTLTDLRAGELGFTSMALGFKLFGLHDWSGRLPLALWGFLGVVVLYELIARLATERAALYAAIALVTMPLYFMQARTMLGDAVTMATFTIAFAGLTGALLDEGGVLGRFPARWAWLALAAIGLAGGYLSRGALVGVAAPLVAIGVAWAALRSSGTRRSSAFDAVGAGALLFGLIALAWGLAALAHQTPEAPLARAVGFAKLARAPVESTFDLTARLLGHGLFPWSAFLPFAIGRLFRAPAADSDDARDRASALRVALLAGAGVAYGVFAFLAPQSGTIPFAAPALLAAIAGVALADLEAGDASSRAMVIGAALLALVLYHDFTVEPEKTLACFVVEKATVPKSFEQQGGRALKVVLLAWLGFSSLAWFERQPAILDRTFSAWVERRARAYREGFAELARVWNGNLLFGMVVIEAAIVGLAAMIFLGRRLAWQPVEALPKNFSDIGLNAWWALPLGIALAPVVVVVTRDAYRHAVAALRVPRSAGAVAGALAAGLALSSWYYPALAAQLSPKEVFASYAKLAGRDEPLALLGVRNRAAAYYSGAEVESFTDATRAFQWLTERMDRRRWMVVKADDLPKLNSLYRGLAAKNLPVLDGRSSQILLVSNDLGAHENESWLAKMILDGPARPTHKVDAAFGEEIEVLGWDVVDGHGEIVESVVPQTLFHLRFFYRVVKPINGVWKAFVHIDGHQRRYNGDHAVLDGKYPMNLWQPGDLVVDDLEFQLEPNFTPGDYTVFFGFFSGETRFPVTRGASQENRVDGGPIRVR